MQSTPQSVHISYKEPPDASSVDRPRANCRSITESSVGEGLIPPTQRPVDFNPFAPLTNDETLEQLSQDEKTPEQRKQSTQQKLITQQKRAKFGSRSNLDETENVTLSTSVEGTRTPKSPNAANQLSSFKQEGTEDIIHDAIEEQYFKQTGGWGGEQLNLNLAEGCDHLYIDQSSEDDLLKNSDEFYENHLDHQNSLQMVAGDMIGRATADFAFVKELSEKEVSNNKQLQDDQYQINENNRHDQRPSLPIKAKPVMLVQQQPRQINSRTLGKEQLGQMQIGYSPLVSQSTKTVNSVIKIPSYRQQASEPLTHSVSHGSDGTPSRLNGESKSFLDRMGETKPATLNSVQQRSKDPMQHTFANLNQQYQAASAQTKAPHPFLTPQYESDQRSEKSAVNPFKIANSNSELQSEEMVTAEGFFKNPTATAKKIETVSKVKNRISMPPSGLQSVSSAQIGSRNSEPVGDPYANLPIKYQKKVSTAASKQQIGSNVSNNSSSGVQKLKRSQIKVSQATDNNFSSDELYKGGFGEQSQVPLPTLNFIQESIWVDQFGKTPFDQTLKPVVNLGLGIRKSHTQDQYNLSHRQQLSSQNAEYDKRNNQTLAEQYRGNFDANNGIALYSRQQERRRESDLMIENTEISLQTMPQQPLQRHKSSSQDKTQSSFRDVFSSGKHYRNASEHKIQNSQAHVLGFGLESPRNGSQHGQHKSNHDGGQAFKTAAKLGLMSQDNPFGFNGSNNPANLPFPVQYQDSQRFSNQGLQQNNLPYEFQNQTSLVVGQMPHFREPPSLPIFPNEITNQNHLMFRKISSQGMMMPQQTFKNLENFGPMSAGRFEISHYDAPVDHFPAPFMASQTPKMKYQDSQLGLNSHQYSGSGDKQRNRYNLVGNSNDLIQIQKMNSYTQGQGTYTGAMPAIVRPNVNVSKNMPACFRENPSQRQRRVQMTTDTIDGNTPPKNTVSLVQVRQPSAQKSRSFSNDARIILQNNNRNQPIFHGQTRVSEPISIHQTRIFNGVIPQKDTPSWQ